jgi:hypothetical protein
MKKTTILILCLLLAIAAPAVARMTVTAVGGGAVAAAPEGDSCTGGLLLSAHFENADDVTTGGGCSAGADSTFALTATQPTYSSTQANDGTYSLYQNNSNSINSHATITVTNRDIISEQDGKVTFYIRIGANFDADNRTYIFEVKETGDDFLDITGIYTGGVNVLRLRYSRDGEGEAMVSTTAGLTVDTWHLVTAAWKVNTNPGLSIKIDAGSAVTGALSNWPWNTTPVQIQIAKGAASGMDTYFMDTLKIYSTSGL